MDILAIVIFICWTTTCDTDQKPPYAVLRQLRIQVSYIQSYIQHFQNTCIFA